MSFTTLNSGDMLPSALTAIIAEMRTAVEERFASIGKTAPTWATDTIRQDRWTNDLNALRAACTNLVGCGSAPYNDTKNCFVDSSWSNFANIGALLTAAGYGGGWVDMSTETNKRVENKDKWTQLQTVIAYLTNYQRKVSCYLGSPGSDGGFREARSLVSENAAWVSALGATRQNIFNYLQYSGWGATNQLPTYPGYAFLLGPVARTYYDFTGMKGTLHVFRSSLDLSIGAYDWPGPTMIFSDGHGNSVTAPTAVQVINYTKTITSGITLNSVFSLEWTLTTSEPASTPGYGTGLSTAVQLVSLPYGNALGGSFTTPTDWNLQAQLSVGNGLTYG